MIGRPNAHHQRSWLPVACLLLAVVVLGAGCGADRVTDPARATTCAELVDAGRASAEQVLERLGDLTLASVLLVLRMKVLRFPMLIWKVMTFQFRTFLSAMQIF